VCASLFAVFHGKRIRAARRQIGVGAQDRMTFQEAARSHFSLLHFPLLHFPLDNLTGL
jgi:hypothetical protein